MPHNTAGEVTVNAPEIVSLAHFGKWKKKQEGLETFACMGLRLTSE